MRLRTGGAQTPKESLHWKLTPGEKYLAEPGNRTCVSNVPVRCPTNWATSQPDDFIARRFVRTDLKTYKWRHGSCAYWMGEKLTGRSAYPLLQTLHPQSRGCRFPSDFCKKKKKKGSEAKYTTGRQPEGVCTPRLLTLSLFASVTNSSG